MFRTLRPGQLAIDIAVPSVLFMAGFVFYSGQSFQMVVILLGMCGALALRRLAPTLSLGVAWITSISQMLLLLPPDPANLAIPIVLYSAASYGSRAIRWLSLASAFVGAALIAGYVVLAPAGIAAVGIGLNPGSFAGDLTPIAQVTVGLFVFLAFAAFFGLAWTAGVLMRTWRKATESRQAQLIAERDVVVEQERNRIARDMHDVVAHSLAVVIAQADGARYALAADPDSADQALRTISSISREALADVRVLLGQLRFQQAEGPQPVMADLDRLYDQLRGAGLEVVVHEHGVPHPVATGSQLAVYRIIQEALTNALRHGDHRAPIEVHLDWLGPQLQLWVVNRSKVELPKAGTGHGLAGMNERATLAGGRFGTTLLDGRFTVYAAIPYTTAGVPA
ncbi:sensor histidine kinase [Plantibacter flavus]|uniref:sensor histidine kinase n=1 Tax=Plantibacter flavus TaxID=150123 RepID=UPI003F163494